VCVCVEERPLKSEKINKCKQDKLINALLSSCRGHVRITKDWLNRRRDLQEPCVCVCVCVCVVLVFGVCEINYQPVCESTNACESVPQRVCVCVCVS